MEVSKVLGIEHFWLTVNRACNNRCPWCYAIAEKFRESAMSISVAERLIAIGLANGASHANIIGGEPTLYPQLEELLRTLRANRLKSTLVTNGRRLSDPVYTEKLVEAGLDGVCLSLKGATREQYRKLTGADGFNEVEKGFENLAEHGIHPHLSLTITDPLLDDLERLFATAIELKPSSLFIEFGNPVVIGMSTSDHTIPHPLTIASTAVQVYDIVNRYSIPYRINPHIPLCLYSEEDLAMLDGDGNFSNGCQLRFANSAVFLENGDTIPCNQLTDHRLGRLDVDYHDGESFKAFWNGDAVRSVSCQANRYPSEYCIDCPKWFKCFGGCPIKWLHYDPRDIIPRRKDVAA